MTEKKRGKKSIKRNSESARSVLPKCSKIGGLELACCSHYKKLPI